MISAIQSALTGLQAHGTKIQSNANNIANSNTEGYKRTRVTLSTMEPGGVKADITKTTNSGPVVYEQSDSGQKPVELSNVDLGQEIPDMMINTHFYLANIKTLQVADQMLDSVLDLKA